MSRSLSSQALRFFEGMDLMTRISTVVCFLFFLALPLLTGCGAQEKSVEDLEPEHIRNERRLKHSKLVPNGPAGANPGEVKR